VPQLRKIAILGASGHIGASLAAELYGRTGLTVDLYSRRPSHTRNIAAAHEVRATLAHRPLSELDLTGCDVVVNAIGLSAPDKLQAVGAGILKLTIDWEERIKAALSTAHEAHESLYVFLSSGAVYGRLTAGGAHDRSVTSFAVNHVDMATAYSRAKFTAETLHRTWRHRRLLDVRVFGYSSTLIDLQQKMFLPELYYALLNDSTFSTSGHDMVRDYVGPRELLSLIEGAHERSNVNAAVDIFSLAPANKFAIIDAMKPLGLKVEVSGEVAIEPTRVNYFTSFKRAEEFGYRPSRSAIEVVVDVAQRLLAAKRRL
jgi:nucleoside-diphosphate-sugar epimerase